MLKKIVFFLVLQENLHKLVELERDLVGIDDLCHPQRVSSPSSVLLSTLLVRLMIQKVVNCCDLSKELLKI